MEGEFVALCRYEENKIIFFEEESYKIIKEIKVGKLSSETYGKIVELNNSIYIKVVRN